MKLACLLGLGVIACHGSSSPSPDPEIDAPQVEQLICSGLSATALGDTVRTITSGGGTRTYALHVPPGYVPTRRMPVVFNLHGYNSNESQQAQLSGMHAKADTEGFLVVEPRGTADDATASGPGSGLAWNAGECCPTANYDDRQPDDVAFLRALEAQLATELCIDPNRVYATGMSNGAFLSHRLACEAGDLFAAIAPVSGTAPVEHLECAASDETTCTGGAEAQCTPHGDAATCNGDDRCTWSGATNACVPACMWESSGCRRVYRVADSRTRTLPADGWSYDCPARAGGVPVIMVHGTSDPLVHPEGTVTSWGRYASIDESVAFWQEKDHATTTPTTSTRYECPFNAECSTKHLMATCTTTANCAWDDDTNRCNSICDVQASCRALPGATVQQAFACHGHAGQAVCGGDPACLWDTTHECTDCRDLTCDTYAGDSTVEICRNESGSHCWPGSGKCSMARDDAGTLVAATDLIWAFFASQRLH